MTGAFIALAAGVTTIVLLLFFNETSGANAVPDGSVGDANVGASGASSSTAPAPSGTAAPVDKVQLLAQAIAVAEGFNVIGSVPWRAHNPGDLGPGDCGSQYATIAADGSDVCLLPDDATGWNLLYAKLSRIASGQSSSYPLSFTFTQMAQRYAGNWQAWVNNVTSYLGVSPSMTLGEYFQ